MEFCKMCYNELNGCVCAIYNGNDLPPKHQPLKGLLAIVGLMVMTGCTTGKVRSLYECHNDYEMEYMIATNVEDAADKFGIDKPGADWFTCAYVDRLSNIGSEKETY